MVGDFLPVGGHCRELLVKISAMVILESWPRLALKFSGGIRSSKWMDFHSPGEVGNAREEDGSVHLALVLVHRPFGSTRSLAAGISRPSGAGRQ